MVFKIEIFNNDNYIDIFEGKNINNDNDINIFKYNDSNELFIIMIIKLIISISFIIFL